MTTLAPTRDVGYAFNQQCPSGDAHRSTPGGVINVDNKQDVEWLLSTGDWEVYGKSYIPALMPVAEVEVVEVTEDVELETPDLDDMTKDEMVEYAQTNGIDVNPRDKKDDIRLIIRNRALKNWERL